MSRSLRSLKAIVRTELLIRLNAETVVLSTTCFTRMILPSVLVYVLRRGLIAACVSLFCMRCWSLTARLTSTAL